MKEEEDVWRTRYVKVYCRQRRVRLFVFADASSSIPVRSYNIHENTYAEIVDKNRDDDEDSSFVFRIFINDDASIVKMMMVLQQVCLT